MQDQTAILIVVGLAAVFFSLWLFSSRQKRKFEEERRQRKLNIERLKNEARKKNNS